MENVAGFEAKLQPNEIEPTSSLDSSNLDEHDSNNDVNSNKVAGTIHSDFLYTIENVEMTSPVIETISDPKNSENSENSLKPKVNFEKSMWDNSKGLKIGDFIDKLSDADFKTYAIDQKVLDSHGYVFDVVMPSSSRSCCFTKSYKHYNEGTGSVLQISGTVGIDKQTSENTRYFTEYEVARLLGFPNDFSFTSKSPNDKSENVTLKQSYKLLGNSLSVIVVSNLVTRLIKQM
ncbi:tRNA (cytosine(38)-C(5))-methyltransferase [Smittium culicis]|uniref:tRNA (cytosine(38)-C(5))-methyltransferase n=1 Tax=Smittium culicis TaxID=133412 RepID=A0A1R1X2P6_9FUNG|nr:tRNA (cytosine(38)-C(5))-methyltransferase [Smittium culicis]OMJ08916.1 tRNA (cytosine(38)-C(5))-methyltransferase [Smittium culicis]OMJ22984.1 tRNA (cytosine(38)-C(5))-methyltransferase [Smittium culicis]